MHPPRLTRPLAAAAAAAMILGGCSNSPSPSAAPTSAAAGPAPSTTSSSPASSPAAGPDRRVIATTGDPASEAGAIEIDSLRRDSTQLVTLRFALVNRGTKDVTVANRFGGAGSRAMNDVSLVDPDGLKKYLTVLDEKGGCLCSSNLSNVRPGERLELFATFAAPPPEVKAVTVVVPSFQPLNAVALT